MGILQTTIKLNDQFSDKLSKINKSIQNTTNAMNRLNNVRVSGGNVNKSLSRQISQNDTILGQMRQWAVHLRTIGTLYFGIKGSIEGINRAVQLSDRMTMNTARLGLMADSKNPVGALETKSFAAAMRARTDYLDFNKAVTKLGILAGDKFANQDSIIRFTELMQKQFAVGGADASERSAAMLQLTQAIASNRLQGDELRSIRENAPLLVKAIQDSLGVSEAKFKDMAKAGEITADVIIKAMAKSASEVETMFNKLPLTWEHVWTRFKNVGYMAFKPIHEQFERLFNDQRFLKFMVSLQNAMVVLGNITGIVLEKIINFAFFLGEWFVKLKDKTQNLIDKFTFLKDAVWAIIGALAIYKMWQVVVLGYTKLIALWNTIASLSFSSLSLIIIGVLAIAIFWIYKTSDSWADAIGKIVGFLFGLVTFVLNVFKAIANGWIILYQLIVQTGKFLKDFITTLAQNIGIAFNNGWSHALSGFWKFVKGCLEGVKSLEPAINAIAKAFGAEGFTVSGAITAVGNKISNAQSMHKSYKQLPSFGDYVNSSTVFEKFEYGDYKDAYYKGYGMVMDVANSLNKLTNTDMEISKTQLEALNGINNGVGDMSDNLDTIGGNTKDIANNTGSTNDYSYLRNWAYRAGMGNSIGYNIKIEQNNQNKIGSNMDLNRVVDAVRDAIIEGITIQAEGVR